MKNGAQHLDRLIALGAKRARLRVLVITNRYPRSGHSTIATYNRQQFRELAREHDVRVIAPVPWTDRVRDLLAHNVVPKSCVQDKIAVRHPTFYFPPKIAPQVWGQFFLWSVRKEVEREIREFKPDVLLACWAHPDGWAATQFARQFGLPVVIKVHGSDILVATKSKRRRERIAEALRAADAVVAVSRDLAQHVIELGVDAKKVDVIHHGVDPHLFSPGNQQEARRSLNIANAGRALLFVGNLLVQKGVGVLLEACAKLAQQKVAFHCYLVGEGHDEPHLRKLRAQLKLEDIVQFVGPCAHEQLANWYRATDLVVLPSFSEGIPNVLREGMMCGKRFVATNVGGIPEITTPEVGILVNPGNPGDLAEAISASLACQDLHVDREAAMRLCEDWETSNRLLVKRLVTECQRYARQRNRQFSAAGELLTATAVTA
jgi:glycosyltransferase involved in cell wall biosynthesis